MTDERDLLLQGVAELARLTGNVAMEYFRPGIAAETKGDGTPVTQADRRAEQVAREWLADHFPQDGILGEEFGAERSDARRRWLIDPIDGTKSFVRHVPLWGTLIAVEEDGKVLAGAAFFPVVNELVAAAGGKGCWWNDSRCSVSAVSSLEAATVLTTDDRFPHSDSRRSAWGRLAGSASVARTWGDCYGYLMVATGRAEVMLDDIVSAWDAACMQPIIEEAGGVFTDFRGVRTPFNGCTIATNAALSDTVRQIMNDREGE
jgi:histidinol phosphatase-like enzyme (inositol monophosphatase family)